MKFQSKHTWIIIGVLVALVVLFFGCWPRSTSSHYINRSPVTQDCLSYHVIEEQRLRSLPDHVEFTVLANSSCASAIYLSPKRLTIQDSTGVSFKALYPSDGRGFNSCMLIELNPGESKPVELQAFPVDPSLSANYELKLADWQVIYDSEEFLKYCEAGNPY